MNSLIITRKSEKRPPYINQEVMDWVGRKVTAWRFINLEKGIGYDRLTVRGIEGGLVLEIEYTISNNTYHIYRYVPSKVEWVHDGSFEGVEEFKKAISKY